MYTYSYYIGGEHKMSVFPTDTWNKFQETISGQQRTNNTCEGIYNFLYLILIINCCVK